MIFLLISDPNGAGSVLTQPTTSHSVLGGGGGGTIFHSCVPSQSQCPLTCAGGYSKGPGGCDFCMCAPSFNNGEYAVLLSN